MNYEQSEQPPFKPVTVRGVRLRPGIDLDRPRSLDIQDDEMQFRGLNPLSHTDP